MTNKNTYWNNNGKHQKEYNELSEQLPNSGMAPTMPLEAVRRISNVYYDLYNNGACNEKFGDLGFVYDWLDARDVEYDRITTLYINYDALYSTSDDNGKYFKMIAKKLERLADVVISTAYNLK